MIGAAAPVGAPPGDESVMSAISRQAVMGAVILAVFLAIFFGWGATAPISGGATAPGRISPEGSRRIIQHLEGGIINEIAVRDGDRVAAGDTLIVLQGTQAQAGFDLLANQRLRNRARLARLRSEQAGYADPVFPDDLLRAAETDPDAAELLDSQREQFRQRRDLHENRKAVYVQRAGQLRAEIAGLEEQILNQNERLRLIESEIDAIRTLVEDGLAPRPRLLALQREQASIREQRAANRAAIARAGQSIGESEVQSLALDAQRLDEISNDLEEAQAELGDIAERLRASEDVLNRTEIIAPIAGAVVNLRFRTIGGVISPGEPILDLVPEDEALIIDARLSPVDVDLVTLGQAAAVHLSALPQSNLPRIEGEVVSISADALTDEATGEPYYNVRVRVDPDVLEEISARLGEEPLRLTPGMPADVLIVTGERTVVDYLTEPLRDSLRNALREG
ncbi:MAG: HlyD family type I secretion periplasmic adaptor subunit [Pseudomonadota bacterium]